MRLTSSAFGSRQAIPIKYSCEGEDVSPPLSVSEVPEGTKSLAVIVDDPDAPKGIFDHWVAWNIPPSQKDFSEGFRAPREGKNHFGTDGYRGPCPPHQALHHYHFKVYALDTMLDLKTGSTKDQLMKAMEGHILGKAELLGTFKRP